MAQGPYDHPSYLTRQRFGLGVSTAGANGVTGGIVFPWDVRLRTAAAVVRVAGTSSTTGNQAIILAIGTTTQFNTGTAVVGTATQTLGTIALGTVAAYGGGTSTDLNVLVKQGCAILLKNGTDATGTFDVCAEGYIDPTTGTWTGPN